MSSIHQEVNKYLCILIIPLLPTAILDFTTSIWPGEGGHRGESGSVGTHFFPDFWKWLKVKLGQESCDAWVRDRVKLRFNLSPFHVLARLHRGKSLKGIQCCIFCLIWWRRRGENIRVQMASLPASISSGDVSVFPLEEMKRDQGNSWRWSLLARKIKLSCKMEGSGPEKEWIWGNVTGIGETELMPT